MSEDNHHHVNGDGRRHSEPNFKRRRVTKACDFCHRRGRKCKPVTEGSGVTPVTGPDGQPSCLTCIEHSAQCTWNRVAAKRGVKSKTSPASIKQPHQQGEGGGSDRCFYDESRHGSRNLVHRLICIFFDTVYPVFVFPRLKVNFQSFPIGGFTRKNSRVNLLTLLHKVSLLR